ncbi:phosphoserine phosphatase [Methanococcus voltae]|uniref:phosphoserine phosphatase SerB n=1 Tax=Methanococcus voltae TaxID=2188 RepID=UPI001AE9E113|nr:phosphoserine phosphatase SerB [Methanococcus voltae]MBP2144129.1 phosphoserine phosphatase [Methanococcus voltae]
MNDNKQEQLNQNEQIKQPCSKRKIILFDLDSTLVDCEVIDELGRLNNVEKEVEQITKDAMDGKLEFEQALEKRVQLLKGLSETQILEFLESIQLMNGAKETLSKLKEHGYITGVVSGGFTFATARVKDLLDLDYHFANELVYKDGVLTGEVIKNVSSRLAKGEILAKIAEKENIDLKDTVVVGDGANDVSMFNIAGLGIAFCAKPVLKDIADYCIDEKDLSHILKILKIE